jgi:hypothetical protein
MNILLYTHIEICIELPVCFNPRVQPPRQRSPPASQPPYPPTTLNNHQPQPHQRANTDKSWDYTKAKDTTTSTDQPPASDAAAAAGAGAAAGGPKPVTGPVDSGLKASLRERIVGEMPPDWQRRLPGTDTCVLVVQGLNMEMVRVDAWMAFGACACVFGGGGVQHGDGVCG